MSVRRFIFTIVLLPALLLGQLNSNTVTVTASQNASSQPDQAIFNLTVGSGVDKSLDDVVKSVASVGISAANLTGITFALGAPPANALTTPPSLQWSFQLPVALSVIRQTTASLGALQQSLAQSGSSLFFSLAGTQSSGAPTQSCDFASLIADAQAQAQPAAAAARSAVGRITGISGSTSQGAGNCSVTVTFGLGYSGNPGPHTISVTASRSASPVPDQLVFLITVQSSIAAGLDDITGALTQAGVTGASLSGVYTQYMYDAQGSHPFLLWSFTMTTPLANLKNTVAQLTAAQTTISKQNSGLTLSASSATPQASQQAQPVCSQATLVADATAQAQALGGAAGVSMGPVTALSALPAVAPQTRVATLSAFINEPLTGSALGAVPVSVSPAFSESFLQFAAPDLVPACSLLVQFQLY